MLFDDDNYAMEHVHPAWHQGRNAFRHGEVIDSNPHDFGTDANEAWAQGWQEALTESNQMTPKHDGRNQRNG